VPDRGPRPRHPRLRVLGFALAAYGLVGLFLFAFVAVAINRPLERAHALSASVEQQRLALVETLGQAQQTLDGMSEGVGGMDTSLADAKAATDRASGLTTGLASSMFGLRDAMSLSIFGAQPLIGLASGFDSSGQQLTALGADLTAIGASLDTNRSDVATTRANLADLATAVGKLTTMVSDSPGVEISTASLDAIRLAVYAICGWLAVVAIGCVVAGAYLISVGGRSRPEREVVSAE
jgi:phage-related protein